MRQFTDGGVAGGAAVAGLLAGLGAVAASSCCILPLALSIAGFGGSWLAGATELVALRPWLLIAAVGAIATGWVAALRRRCPACAAGAAGAAVLPGPVVLGTLGLATMLVAVAAAWAWIEPAAIAALLRLAWAVA